MSKDLRIDSHKLIFHPKRVADWLKGEVIYPLTVEISPSGACNHRCRFCAFDYLGYSPSFLEEELMIKNLTIMAQKGVKAIVVAGEGEPLLNKSTITLIKKIKELGMDASMSSNGVLFTGETAAKILPDLTWVRFSVNAGTAQTHHLIHQGKPDDFQVIINNLTKAVEIKQKRKLAVTLGVQMILLPENFSEAVSLGRILKDIGIDYLTVKPYSQHPKSINRAGAAADYQAYLDLETELNEKLQDDHFQIYFRASSMKKLHQTRRYECCLGAPFWAYIDSQANLWACLAYIGDLNFCYGNLHQASFAEIWEGEGRTRVMNHLDHLDISHCRELCRLDEINAYLHQLKHPGGHVNFI